jgi:hypothetical protein
LISTSAVTNLLRAGRGRFPFWVFFVAGIACDESAPSSQVDDASVQVNDSVPPDALARLPLADAQNFEGETGPPIPYDAGAAPQDAGQTIQTFRFAVRDDERQGTLPWGTGLVSASGGDMLFVGHAHATQNIAIGRIAPNGFLMSLRGIAIVSGSKDIIGIPAGILHGETLSEHYVVGSVAGPDRGPNSTSFVLKIDGDRIVWAKLLEGADCAGQARALSGGMFLACTTSVRVAPGRPTLIAGSAIRIDRMGNVLWATKMSFDQNAYGHVAVAMSDGKFLWAGNTRSFDPGLGNDGLIALFRDDGSVEWIRTVERIAHTFEGAIAGIGIEAGKAIVSIEMGPDNPETDGRFQSAMIRISPTGEIEWKKRYNYLGLGPDPELMGHPRTPLESVYAMAAVGDDVVTCSSGGILRLNRDGEIVASAYRTGSIDNGCGAVVARPEGKVAMINTTYKKLPLADPTRFVAMNRFEILQLDQDLRGICGLSVPNIVIDDPPLRSVKREAVVASLSLMVTPLETTEISFSDAVTNYNCPTAPLGR